MVSLKHCRSVFRLGGDILCALDIAMDVLPSAPTLFSGTVEVFVLSLFLAVPCTGVSQRCANALFMRHCSLLKGLETLGLG